jgi:sulfotransferase family protein
MTLPTFLVIGAMKGGTTTLWEYLKMHPEVFMARPKEVKFFMENRTWSEGVGWYEAKFAGAGDAKARGEASTGYTMAHSFPGVPGRIASLIPDVKLIYLLREPIDRMVSHYFHRRSHRKETRSLTRAMLDPTYLFTSRYAYQLDHYLEHFSRDQILLLTSEALRDRRTETLRRVFEFIGVDPARAQGLDEVAKNRTLDKKIQPIAVEKMRGRGPYRLAAAVVPRPARKLVRKLTTRPLEPEELSFPEELRARTVEALRPDVARLRTYMEPGFDGWGIA